jgi:predicted nucleotidyltransferase
LLTRQQQVGLDRYEELLLKIPRSEVEEIFQVVNEACQREAPGAECVVCGSYRRGKKESGDVDVLILPPLDHPSDALDKKVLPRLIKALEEAGFLTDHLALPTGYKHLISPTSSLLDTDLAAQEPEERSENNDEEADGSSDSGDSENSDVSRKLRKGSKRISRGSYMGVCKLSKPNSLHRRIDMKVYSPLLKKYILSFVVCIRHIQGQLLHMPNYISLVLII